MLKLFRPAPVIDPLPKEKVDKEYKKLRWQVFLGIFIGYAGYYLVRKNFSICRLSRRWVSTRPIWVGLCRQFR